MSFETMVTDEKVSERFDQKVLGSTVKVRNLIFREIPIHL